MDARQAELFETRVRQALSERRIPGAVCVAASGERVLYRKSFGSRDLHTNAPMTPDTVFMVASMTKPIVASACMQLVSQGILDLDRDVGDYVADFKNPLVLEGFDDAGVPQLRNACRAVTLRHLLSNSSGITHEYWDPKRAQWCRKFGLSGFGREARRAPLCCDPGEGWSYGLSLDWAAEVLSAVTGQTLEAYLQENIFRPLGMYSTSFHLLGDMAGRRAAIHIRNDTTPLTSNTVLQRVISGFPPYHDYGDGEGNGGLYTTAEDYTRFLQMILRGGEGPDGRILSPESVAEMRKNQIGDKFMAFPPPLKPGGFGIDLTDYIEPGQKAKWGLGWVLNPQPTSYGRKAWGMSWFGGYDTYMWADPDSDLCGVMMIQMKTAALPDVISLVYDFERMLHGLL